MSDNSENNVSVEKLQERVFKPKRDDFLKYYKKNSLFRWIIKIVLLFGILITTYSMYYYYEFSMIHKYYIYFSLFFSSGILLILFINKYSINSDKRETLIENNPKNKYMLSLGLEVKKFYGDAKKSLFPNNIVRQLLYNAEKFKRHMIILATIGGGKTFLMKGLAEQQIILGGGGFFIDGKGTAEFAKEMFAIAKLYGREKDFIHLNFLDMQNTHSINPLQVGTVNSLYEILTSLLIGEENQWKNKQKEYIKNVLKLLVYKRDNENLDLNFSVLTEYMTLSKLVNEALLYKEDAKSNSSLKDFVNFISSSIAIELNEFLYSDFKIVYDEDDKVNVKGKIPKQDNPFLEKVKKNESNSNLQGVYDASMSANAWRSVLTTLGSDYKNILNQKDSTISLWEVIQYNKLLFITLPTMDSDQTPKELGRLMLGLLKNVAQEKAKFAIQPEIPFLAIFDEIGSYIINGFGRLMSKCRSLGIAVVPIFQSFAQIDLVDEGKGLETKEILDVTGTLVVMKVTSPEVTELINRKLKQIRYIDRNYQEQKKHIKSQAVSTDSFQVLQEEAIKHFEVEKMNNGEMLVITDGEIHRAVANVERNFTLYGKIVTYEGIDLNKKIPLTQYMDKKELFKQIKINEKYWKKEF
ncbi:hypothetical protein CRU99_07720 [Malaciobacter mytili]|uniref:TraM recognition domain-containing protein n=1 Tax=Malaciobacter mytili TaxID=603050 RepID=UPI00100ADC96|nr:TraM recognition domain-containing protein [Malaciobacter mytili]RXI43413.1 hypothetical protein CRU99_07720 [Malaciobacter mytili]